MQTEAEARVLHRGLGLGFRSGNPGLLSTARAGDCRPRGRWGWRRSYLESRARPARGPRRAARPSAGNTLLRPRPAPAAGPASPPCPPWPLAWPGPAGALCWQRRQRLQGRGTAALSRRPMTAQRRGWWRRRRGPRPVARHSQSEPAPGQRRPVSGRGAAANRGAPGVGPQLGAAGRGSEGRWRVFARLAPPRPVHGARLTERRAAAPPTSVSFYRPVQWAEVFRRQSQKPAFLQHARSGAYCVQGTRGRWAREPALGGHLDTRAP